MRNPVFKKVKPNYRKRVLEVTLGEGRTTRKYNLPFTAFEDKQLLQLFRLAELAGYQVEFNLKKKQAA